MNRTRKIIAGVIAAALALVIIFAVIHNAARDKVPEGAVLVRSPETETYIDLSEDDLKDIKGVVVNAKGDEIAIDAKGVLLSEALKEAELDPEALAKVVVTARDEFSAVISPEELGTDDKVWLSYDEAEGYTLIVFGDSDLKRNVRDVAVIDAE